LLIIASGGDYSKWFMHYDLEVQVIIGRRVLSFIRKTLSISPV